MTFVCHDCGYESGSPGDCPDCEVTLLKEEGSVVEEPLGEDTEDEVVADVEEW